MLDKSKTYIYGVVTPPGLCDRIKQDQDCKIPLYKRWVHVGAIYFDHRRDGEWKVVHADLKRGVERTLLRDELKECCGKAIWQVYEDSLSPRRLHSLIGTPFDLQRAQYLQTNPFLTINLSQKPSAVTCGDVINYAMCSHNRFGSRPVDFQRRGQKRGLFELTEEDL